MSVKSVQFAVATHVMAALGDLPWRGDRLCDSG